MPCTCFAAKPSLRRYYLMLNEKITKQKTYQMCTFLHCLDFFDNHVIGPLADYTVSFFGW